MYVMRNPSEHFSHDDSEDAPPLSLCVNAHVLMHVCIHVFACECGGQRLHISSSVGLHLVSRHGSLAAPGALQLVSLTD